MKPNELKMERIKKDYRDWFLDKEQALNLLWKELRKLPWFKTL